MDESLRQLLNAARELRGSQNGEPTREEFVEFAYGQAALENPAVAREIAERAVADLLDGSDAVRVDVAQVAARSTRAEAT